MKKNRNWFLLFWLIAIIDLIIIASNNTSLRFYTKPLLVPSLMLAYFFYTGIQNSLSKLIIAGLFFSFLGDVFLLWDEYFIQGLICFLTTHILYTAYFIITANKNGWHFKKYPLLIIPVSAYTMALLWLLLPSLGDLTIPVVVYAIVISVMLLSGINLYKKIKSLAYIYFIAGAGFFILSDSLLAINKFYQPFAYSGITIMLTYILAQYFIVKGSIFQINN